jgi:nucleoside-diphosphate kinase
LNTTTIFLILDSITQTKYFKSANNMEKTLVIIKPGTIQRGLIGEVTMRFERKGLQLCGIKMMQLTDEILASHYAHLVQRPYFKRIKDSMMITPVIVCCWKGLDAVHIVHEMAGKTNGREAALGTIRGDFSMSIQENIIHTSDSLENAKEELARFFKDDEIFEFDHAGLNYLYANDEI